MIILKIVIFFGSVYIMSKGLTIDAERKVKEANEKIAQVEVEKSGIFEAMIVDRTKLTNTIIELREKVAALIKERNE